MRELRVHKNYLKGAAVVVTGMGAFALLVPVEQMLYAWFLIKDVVSKGGQFLDLHYLVFHPGIPIAKIIIGLLVLIGRDRFVFPLIVVLVADIFYRAYWGLMFMLSSVASDQEYVGNDDVVYESSGSVAPSLLALVLNFFILAVLIIWQVRRARGEREKG